MCSSFVAADTLVGAALLPVRRPSPPWQSREEADTPENALDPPESATQSAEKRLPTLTPRRRRQRKGSALRLFVVFVADLLLTSLSGHPRESVVVAQRIDYEGKTLSALSPSTPSVQQGALEQLFDLLQGRQRGSESDLTETEKEEAAAASRKKELERRRSSMEELRKAKRRARKAAERESAGDGGTGGVDGRGRRVVNSSSSNSTRRRKTRRRALFELSMKSHYDKMASLGGTTAYDYGLAYEGGEDETDLYQRIHRSSESGPGVGSGGKKVEEGPSVFTASSGYDDSDYGKGERKGEGEDDYVYEAGGCAYYNPPHVDGHALSYWTYRFCPGADVIQFHLEPEKSEEDGGGEVTTYMVAAAMNDLGQYLDPDSGDDDNYELVARLKFALSQEELQSPTLKSGSDAWYLRADDTRLRRSEHVEYYLGGDRCTVTEPTDTSGGQSTSGRQKARVRVRRRATRVVIHKEFCPPHTSPNSRKGEDNEVIKFLSQNEAEVRVLSVDEPAPCLYELLVCREFRDEEGKVYGGEGGSAVADNAKRNSLGKREDDYHVDSDGGRKVGTGAETGETPILDCSEKKLGNPEDDSGGGDIDRGEEEDETGDKISKTMHTDSDLSETIILGESDNDNDVESTKKASEVEVKTKADPEVQSDESTNGACMEGATDGQGSPPQTQSSSSPAAREAEEILLQYLHEAERGQDRRRSDNSGSNSDTYFNGAGTASDAFPPFPPSKAEENLRTIEVMFQRSYDSYMYNAYPLGELRPISCKGGHFNLVKLPALTLIDALDTLILMGNYTEFARSAERLRILDNQKREEFGEMFPTFTDPGGLKNAGLFAANQNVSLFETNIRVLGGLLGAHQLAEAHTIKKVLLVDVFNKEGGVRIGNHGPVPVQCDHGSCAGAETELRTGDISSSDRPFCLASSRNGAAEAEYDVLNSRPTTLIPDVSMGSRRNGGNGSGSGGQCLLNDEAAPASSTRRKAKANLNSTSSAECGRGRGFVDDAAGIGAAAKTTASLMDYWSYDGFLLTLAHDIGLRLLPAFSTETGIPYGTVNLLYGIPPDETTIASLAGAGTLTLEMELLSRLTGDPSFGAAARLASRALWTRRSANLDLLGKHIDVHTGRWTETLSGIGSNSDSYYEYLIKHHTLFPDDGADFWPMFLSIYDGVHQNSREGEWYPDVDMNAGVGRGGSPYF